MSRHKAGVVIEYGFEKTGLLDIPEKKIRYHLCRICFPSLVAVFIGLKIVFSVADLFGIKKRRNLKPFHFDY
jgi:hypothetical protein